MYRQAAIVGIGHTDYSKASGRSEWQLAVESIKAALDDGGVDASEVDGVVRYSYDNITPAQLVRSFSIPGLSYYADVPFGGTATAGVIAQAAGAIASGQASVVVVYRAMNERSGVRYGRAERNTASTSAGFVASGDMIPSGAFAAPYGLLSPGQYMAMLVNRYAFENQVSAEDLTRALGTVAVQQRAYARNNPDAMMGDRPLTMEDYEASRVISSPLRLFDYCLETDGAVAVVLVGSDRAAATRDDAAYFLSGGQNLRRDQVYQRGRHQRVLVDPPSTATARLYEDARLTPKDIDVAMFYDHVSYSVMTALEGCGFAAPGQGWKHMIEHGIGLDSPIPVNTHGGHLSEGYMHGMNHIVEAVRQLRGTSPNQLDNVQNVLVSSNSGVIFGRGE